MTDDQKAIDVAESLRDKAEQLSEAAGELRALSVNVANLQEIARVQHEALEGMINRYAPSYHDCVDDGLPECELCEARAALAKYNDVMGEGNESAD